MMPDALSLSDYDFVDFGCSDGKSLDLARLLFKGERGLGIDIDPKKVSAARLAGHEAMQTDITALGANENATRFVMAHHFLEHIPNLRDAANCIKSACLVARDFVFIKQPYFDADPYLMAHGLKFYWSDWDGHPNRMTSADFAYALHALKTKGFLKRFLIYAVSPVSTSEDASIHPLHSPPNQHAWEAGRHPAKSIVALNGVFREIAVLIQVRDFDGFADIERRAPKSLLLYDSAT